MLNETEPGWSILETGSGWATLSATLARHQPQVTLLDWSNEVVNSGLALLNECDLGGTGICADLFASLPFSNNSFDCVWRLRVRRGFPPIRTSAHPQIVARVAKKKEYLSSRIVCRLPIVSANGTWNATTLGSSAMSTLTVSTRNLCNGGISRYP